MSKGALSFLQNDSNGPHLIKCFNVLMKTLLTFTTALTLRCIYLISDR